MVKTYVSNIEIDNDELLEIYRLFNESATNGTKIILNNIKKNEAKKILERTTGLKINNPSKIKLPFKN